MSFLRSSGIILHPTSLPTKYGVGDLGDGAYKFVDFLEASCQHIWQILPLGQTGFGDSPYQCLSAFAGNTLLISPDKLVESGYLQEEDLDPVPSFPSDKVDFGKVIDYKKHVLKKAFERFKRTTDTGFRADFLGFCQKEAEWLEDYALFLVLKEMHGGNAWNTWHASFALRDSAAIAKVKEEKCEQIEAEMFYQYLFFKQWLALRAYCNQKEISIVGDVPIFVAYDSCDVWTKPEQFKLNSKGEPIVVAGVPPDYFSATGQLWGNPLYDWDVMRSQNFSWWISRMKAILQMVDIIRIDHFRGFAACWEIPGGDETAQRGRWVEVPGRELFDRLKEVLGELPIIVEDLGVITPDVEQLRDDFAFPGMRILQMAFRGDSNSMDLPHNYIRNCVVHTGTHDNDTIIGWFNSEAGAGSTRDASQIENERLACLKYLRSNGKEINWDFIAAAFASVADLGIVPLQDVLGLGSKSRMNLPASQEGNWIWRFQENDLTDAIAERLRDLTVVYGRDRQALRFTAQQAVRQENMSVTGGV